MDGRDRVGRDRITGRTGVLRAPHGWVARRAYPSMALAALLLALALLAGLPAGCASRTGHGSKLPAKRPAGIPESGEVLYWRDGRFFALDLTLWQESHVADVKHPRTVACSPDGAIIAAVDITGEVPSIAEELVIIDRTAGTVRRLPCEDDARELLWSPQGLYLAVDSGTAVQGTVSIYSAKDWRLVAQTGQTGGLFSLDNRYYAYSFCVDVGLPVEGGGSSGIGLIDLTNPTTPAYRTLFDGRDGYAYEARDWVYEGLVFERRPVDEAPGSDSGPDFGMINPDGAVMSLRPGDPWIRQTYREAVGKALDRFGGNLGRWLDLSADRCWLVFTRVIDGENWVVAWDAASELADPVPLVNGEGAVWLKGPKVNLYSQFEGSTYPFYVRSLDPGLRILSTHDLGQGRKLLEATSLPAPRDDSRLFFVYEGASGLYYLIIGEADNARFVRQEGEEVIFTAQGGGESPELAFPYQPVFHLDSKTLEVRHPFLPVDEEVRFGYEGSWPQVIAAVSRTADGKADTLSFELRPVEGTVLAGGWAVPWTVSSYDATTLELTLTLGRASLGPDLKPSQPLCKGQGDGLVQSVVLEPTGLDLRVTIRLGGPAVWNAGEPRIVGERRALWEVVFQKAP